MINLLLQKNTLNKNYINRNTKVVLDNKKIIKIFLIFTLLVLIIIFYNKFTTNYKLYKLKMKK